MTAFPTALHALSITDWVTPEFKRHAEAILGHPLTWEDLDSIAPGRYEYPSLWGHDKAVRQAAYDIGAKLGLDPAEVVLAATSAIVSSYHAHLPAASFHTEASSPLGILEIIAPSLYAYAGQPYSPLFTQEQLQASAARAQARQDAFKAQDEASSGIMGIVRDVASAFSDVAPLLKIASFVLPAVSPVAALADTAVEEVASDIAEEIISEAIMDDWETWGDWDVGDVFGSAGIGSIEIPTDFPIGTSAMGPLNDLLYQLGTQALNEVFTDSPGGNVVTLPGGAVTQTAFPALPALGAIGGTIGRTVAGTIGRAGGLIATTLGNITRKKAVALAKTMGVQAAAAALGIGAVQLADMVIADQQKRRRGAGISASNMRTTTKTLRKFHTMQRRIKDVCGDVMPRRKACK